ncbi:uncharacterized protein BJ171DRAFT_511366 [Polychytrium aggregatum]|uniref:uncharacterized protein n=1 Tax=Polychytrium aggregatum TaxID=110093 RepID=UPI0022FF045C|nr:uncharacterized protein BJ171DRAFT_511366 [Polychytrium aggregatum]KAI9202957.1 hypothetical protein BJ171DRAFT_511366 [Polychytrium aggregatum]
MLLPRLCSRLRLSRQAPSIASPYRPLMSAPSSEHESLDDIKANLAQVQERVTSLAGGRDVCLVAVSKTKPSSDIRAAYETGHRHFGENIQELVSKANELPDDIQWHFIGSLQSNKCKLLASIPNLYMVETIDGTKKADAMNKACAGRPYPLRVMIQVNTSGEDTKSGVHPQEIVEAAKHIISNCDKLQLEGLMTIGSPGWSPEAGPNPDFVLLGRCKSEIEQQLQLDRPLGLSMGMSDDFEHAIALGSTNVRVGSIIFGKRFYPSKS